MYCAINARQLQYSLTVTRPGVDCVQVTFTPHLSALQEVFSDWRSVVWYIYGDFCADRCIVFIVTFPFTEYEVRRHATIGVFKGALKRIHLVKTTTVEGRRRIGGLLLFCKVKRETFAIWITACHDNSGSSDLKCAVYRFCGIVTELRILAVLLWFGSHFRGGWRGGEERRGGLRGKGAGTM